MCPHTAAIYVSSGGQVEHTGITGATYRTHAVTHTHQRFYCVDEVVCVCAKERERERERERLCVDLCKCSIGNSV
jgi:hypothetical protein